MYFYFSVRLFILFLFGFFLGEVEDGETGITSQPSYMLDECFISEFLKKAI